MFDVSHNNQTQDMNMNRIVYIYLNTENTKETVTVFSLFFVFSP